MPLLVERNFLGIVFSKAGDINSLNNILGLDGKTGITQLRAIGCDSDMAHRSPQP